MIKLSYLLYLCLSFSNGYNYNLKGVNKVSIVNNKNPFGKKYYEEYLQQKYKNNSHENREKEMEMEKRLYPLTRPDFAKLIKRLNSKNVTIQNRSILGLDNFNEEITNNLNDEFANFNINGTNNETNVPKLRIILNRNSFFKSLGINVEENPTESSNENPNEDDDYFRRHYANKENKENLKSKHFEVINNYNILFKHVGGYENVKKELEQCIDILQNYQKYTKYNVRIPKGLILEGPPGTGKTLLAKSLAGESKSNFISVSGSDFQEKYVGVGPTRIKELFSLAKKNVPCIIFIDEIDALGRKRSSDGDSSSSERDNTLNALLVELDGFKNNTGIFLVAATNRIDLLDNALTRPGRIDKQIYIGLPDTDTREAIIKIHINGKPYGSSVGIPELVEITEGLSGAQIENLLNEAMLNALRVNKTKFCYKDVDFVMNKMLAGWQPVEHEFTNDIIDHIAIHEMGHAIVGLLSKFHSKMSKVVINLSSPKSPGYTVFKNPPSNIYKREALFEHLMILLSGRIAEEVFYNVSVTNGAINDFEEALKLAQRMVVYYGMGTNIIYPSSSEKYKELIDNDVIDLINSAYNYAQIIIINCKELIEETAEILKRDKILKADSINELINIKYKHLLELD